jgi:8-oxo-dGTP pyrophosphatase MutT (NUDIX family)
MRSAPATDSTAEAAVPQAVVAVALRGEDFLVIRRSPLVKAPGMLCMPGGRVEPGESQPAALIREMREELSLLVEPRDLIWTNRSPWGTQLWWWSVELPADAVPIPNPLEVESFAWLRPEELLASPDLLPSATEFLRKFQRGEIVWRSR